MNSKEMIEDFVFLVDKFERIHFSTYKGFNRNQVDIISIIRNKLVYNLDIKEFIFLINKFVVSVNDSHSRLMIPFKDGDNYISLKCIWIKDGIYILENKMGLREGDKIICINGKDDKKILELLKNIIPNENEYLVKAKAFNKYNKLSFLFSKEVLSELDLIKDRSVEVCISRDNQILFYNIEFEKYSSDYTEDKWLDYSIDTKVSLGVLRLDECIYNDFYKSKLNEFFKSVSKEKIKNVAIDLRKNMGGDARVIKEFLSYINIDTYKDYSSCERCSNDIIEVYRRNLSGEEFDKFYKSIKNGYREYVSDGNDLNERVPDKKMWFDGDIYAITSNLTFSSARYFSVILKDNNLAKIVGEPTGGKPSSYGNVVRFELPNSKIRFSVSTKQFIRPNELESHEETLYPDIILNSNIDDLVNNIDTQIEGLKKYIQDRKKI